MIDFLTGLFLAAIVIVYFTATAQRAYIWYGVNSFVLGLLALVMADRLEDEALLYSGLITLILKGVVIPVALIRASLHFGLKRYLKPRIALQHNMLLIPTVLVASWWLVAPMQNSLGTAAHYVALSLAALVLSMLYMVEHRHIAAKIVGFLLLENSLFFLGTLATGGMPMLVELGIFFDLMMAVIVINLLLRQEPAQ